MDILLLALIQGGEAAPARGAGFISAMPFVFMAIAFWVLFVVPQRRQAKEHLAMVQALQKGDQVVTVGGLVGVITAVRDDQVELRSGSSTVVVERSKISRRVDAGGPKQA